jgi:phage minor structural protein
MADVFVYDANAEDFDTLGLCGPLSPTKCVHIEEANGMSELTIEHPIDQEGRWAYLIEGRIIKADVPVRTVPPITDAGDLVTSIEVWSIKSGMRPHLYYKANGGKIRKKKLASELEVRIVLKGENRYKAAFTGRKKVKKKWRDYVYYGWIPSNALEYVTVESIPSDPEAIEQVAPAWKVTDQLFRIHATKLTDKGVTVSARHIWYDLLGNVTTWTGLVGGVNAPECLDALHGILDNCTLPHDFEGYTNIIGTRDTIEWTRISPVEALCDPETGLLARWGAELVRDNMEFYALAEAGLNRGVRIEYAKNLLGVTCDVDMTDVVTRIQPVGQNAKGKPLLLAAGTYTVDGQSITIDETGTVVSPRESSHPTPHIMVLDVSDAKAAGTSAAQVRAARVKMIRAALAKFAEDADLPRVSLKVDFIALGDTEEYAQYQRLDDVFLYDRVRVWHPKIGVDVLTKVNRIEFDCLLERFNSVELGAVRRDWTRTQVATWQVPAQLPGYKVAAGSLTSAQFADKSINDDQIADGAVQAQHIAEAQIDKAHIKQATVDELMADSITALTAKIENIIAGGIVTDELYAALAEVVTLRVAQAVAGTITTDELRAALANIANVQIGVADIDFGQIKDLIAQEAILEQGVGGEFFFKKLAITDANILGLTVGSLVVRGNDGKYYRVSVGEDGVVTSAEVKMDGENIAEDAIEGRHIVEDSILTRHLNADEIFGQTAIITKILAGLVNTGMLVANEAFIGQLTASDAILRHIRSNATPRSAHLPSSPAIGQTLVYTGGASDEAIQWTGDGANPTRRRYAASASGAAVSIRDLSDDRGLSVTVKTIATQAGSGTPSPGNVRAISGRASVAVSVFGVNLFNKAKAAAFASNATISELPTGVRATANTTGSYTYVYIDVGPLSAFLGKTLTLNFASSASGANSPQGSIAYTNDNYSQRTLARNVQNGSGTLLVPATAPEGRTRLTVAFYANNNGTAAVGDYVDYTNVQLEIASAPGAYVAYAGADYALTPDAVLYGLPGLEGEIRSDGSVYDPTRLMTLSGSSGFTWSAFQPADTNLARFTLSLPDKYIDAGTGLCSHFKWVAPASGECATGHGSSAQLNIYLYKSRMSGWSDSWTDAQKVAAFQSWLSGRNVQVLYRLAAASSETIAPVRIIGADGVNTVASSGASVDVSYTGSGWKRLANDIIGTNVTITDDKFRVASSEVEFAIYGENGEEAISKIDEGGAYFPALEAPDVAPRWPGPYTLTVNPAATPDEAAGAYNSLQAVADALAGVTLDRMLTVAITSGATLYGNAEFRNITGAHVHIQTSGAEKPVLAGYIYLTDCPCGVRIGNMQILARQAASSVGTNRNCLLILENCIINRGAYAGNCVHVDYGASAYISGCEFYGGRGLYAAPTARVTMTNCKGGDFADYAASSNGATVLCGGTIPAGTYSKGNNGILDTTGCTQDAGTGSTPPAAETVVSYDATSSGYYRTAWQSGSQMRQGYTGYELTGWFRFDNAGIRAALSGKTIKDAKLRLRRISGLGVSTAIKVRLYGTTKGSKSGGQPDRPILYGNIGTIGNGKTVTFTIPAAAISDLVSGAINGFVLYARDGAKLAGKEYSANYGGYYGVGSDGPQITVTY